MPEPHEIKSVPGVYVADFRVQVWTLIERWSPTYEHDSAEVQPDGRLVCHGPDRTYAPGAWGALLRIDYNELLHEQRARSEAVANWHESQRHEWVIHKDQRRFHSIIGLGKKK